MVMALTFIVLIALAVIATIAHGDSRWQKTTMIFRAGMQAKRLSMVPNVYDTREIEGLPPCMFRLC